MKELVRAIRKLAEGRQTEVVPQPEIPQNTQRIIDPVRDLDAARLRAFLIPGVVRGTVPIKQPDGSTLFLDFDNRDEHGKPTRRIIP